MSGNNTANTSALRRAEVYSRLILDEIQDNFLPEGISRDVSDFGDGDTLNIPTVGEVVLRDLDDTADQDIPIDPIDTGNITLTITEFVGSGLALTDKQAEDSHLASEFDALFVPKQLRAIKERWETDLLAQSEKQTQADPNTINGLAHRYVASGGNGQLTLDDLVYAKLVMQKAEVPEQGWILIVDPIAEAAFNSITNLTNVSNNPMFEGIVTTGFAKNMKFLVNVFGFDVFVSNRLPRVGVENVDTSGITTPAPSGNGTSGAASVVCQAMAVTDETIMPYMSAMRRMPRTEGERNPSKNGGQDEFYTTSRWGHGLQRPQSLVSIIISETAYK